MNFIIMREHLSNFISRELNTERIKGEIEERERERAFDILLSNFYEIKV